MEIVCIDLSTWEMLRMEITRLTSEVSALKELYQPNPRDG